MINLMAYSGIVTKIKAMNSHLISVSDYKKISELETPSDFFQFLKNHPGYANFFRELDEHKLHRGKAETYLMNSFAEDFAKIYRFATFNQRRILELIFTRSEINILKTCIRVIFSDDYDIFDLSVIHPFFKKHSKLNIEKLSTSKNMDEFISHLKGTDYYFLFQKLRKTSHVTAFDYEIQLDIYYFTSMWKMKDNQLKGDNIEVFTQTLGTEIDLLNLEWLFRSKMFYHFQSSNVYAYIIPVHYKLSKGNLTSLLETNSLDEFIGVIKNTYYKRLGDALEHGDFEKTIQNILLKTYEEAKNKYPNSMAPIVYHLHLKELELNRITTALECIRYKLEPSEILSYVLQ
jgi:V/A-type H+/Na+-transporting ATPase subunit C